VPDTWPRTYVVVAHRGLTRSGEVAKRPCGTIVNLWRESLYERMYAAGTEEADSNTASCAWVQRIAVASVEDRDALREAIGAKTATISLDGIDAETKATLQQRVPFINRSRTDGRVRTAKGDLSLGGGR
jgi:hypothetical protein